SGSSTDKHAAARAFLAPEAAKWDDTTGVTVLDGQIDTVPAPGAPDSSTGATTIRVRGTQIGRLTQAGAFEPAQSPVQWDVDVVDLPRTGALDATARRLLAAQVVLSLAEVNVGRVRLLVDGEPLVAERPEWTRDDVAGTVADVQPGADVPALVVAGGRVAQLS